MRMIIKIDTLPAGLSLRQPATLLATWFGSGLIRPASGTWGSLATLPLALPLLVYGGPVYLLFAAFILFPLGLWASAHYSKHSGEHDSGRIVIDESCGLCLALAPCSAHWLWIIAGFALFRLFDIWKVGLVGWCDRKLPGAWGVMMDDVVAGLKTAGVILIIQLWIL